MDSILHPGYLALSCPRSLLYVAVSRSFISPQAVVSLEEVIARVAEEARVSQDYYPSLH